MILIADGGSTKIDWCLLDNRTVVKRFASQGVNPVMLTREEITYRLNFDIAQPLQPYLEQISKLYFYGAGCLPGDISATMADALRHILEPHCAIEVNNDLLAAARALCGRSPGIACIIGTGSNSCFYDGRRIVDNVPALGYILGDEGSGAVLGRQFVGDVLKRRLPEGLCSEFLNRYNLNMAKVIQRVYRDPAPNRFLASLCPFIHEHLHMPEIATLVREKFIDFFHRNIDAYSPFGSYPINFVGSIAFHFSDLLKEAATTCGYVTGLILPSPMEGLIAYHTNLS